MKPFPATLSRYFARIYVLNVLFLIGAMLAVIWLFDSVELLRRASKRSDVPLSVVLEMGLLKLPDVGQVVLPFAMLFAAMFTFWQLARRGELVVARASGLSVWQFLGPVVAVAILAGILHMGAINPLGSVFLARFNQMERTYLTRQKSLVSLFREGLWLRQTVGDDGSDAILHAAKIRLPEWKMQDVTVLLFAPDGSFAGRIDAGGAALGEKAWVLQDAEINLPAREPEHRQSWSLPTTLTRQEIEESFASPDSMSFWHLPGYIGTLESTGFDATRLRIHFQALLSQPLLFAAMVLLAAAVSLRPPRTQSNFGLILFGIVTGFSVFFLSSYLQALGTAHQIPVLLAAWSPALVTFLLGVGVLLRTEDG